MKVLYKILIVFFVFFIIVSLHLFNTKEGAIGDNIGENNSGNGTPDSNRTPGMNGNQSQLHGTIRTMIDRIFNQSKKTYNYCLGGEIMCPSGNLVPVTDSYSGGTTYSYLCSNKTEPICANNYFIESDASNGYLDYEVGGVEFVFNTQDGFSSPYNTPDAPFIYDMSSNMIRFIHQGNYADNVDICKFLGSDSRTTNCM
jgi:hypothetical protein